MKFHIFVLLWKTARKSKTSEPRPDSSSETTKSTCPIFQVSEACTKGAEQIQFYRYLDCGILARGFARCACEECGRSFAVAFSYKSRSFCGSCMGRRMADTAAHLVDNVFPHVPVRQWVFGLPIEIRYRMSYDKRLISDVLAVFLRVVQGWYKKKAKEQGYVDVQGGAVSFVQKFGTSLNTTPHYHSLVLDGVHVSSNDTERK
ncbi:MAG: hypothetical protein GY847_37905 [Proteobacteria bacterium]|nr:hypothetical protein [Pseudomonadota bacterium]